MRKIERELGWILFVDDDEQIVEVYSQLLRRLGCKVRVAVNGKEALSIVTESSVKPQLIITDQNMPIMTGVDLARELLGSKIPIMLYSSTSILEDDVSLFDEIITKPGNPGEILSTAEGLMAA